MSEIIEEVHRWDDTYKRNRLYVTVRCSKCKELRTICKSMYIKRKTDMCKNCSNKFRPPTNKKYSSPKIRSRVDQYIRKSTYPKGSGTYDKNRIPDQYKMELTREEIHALVIQPCYYCGIIDEVNGIDRVDSTQHYHKDNVVPCCTTCNHAKGTLTVEEFKKWIKVIYSNFLHMKP